MAARGRDALPKMTLATTVELGDFLCQLRRSVKARQVDLARRAGVSRHWIVALEQGKPSCEIGLVLRTLETLGLEIELKPYLPTPPWIIESRRAAELQDARQRNLRRLRKRTRREAARLNRLARNGPKVMVDLE